MINILISQPPSGGCGIVATCYLFANQHTTGHLQRNDSLLLGQFSCALTAYGMWADNPEMGDIDKAVRTLRKRQFDAL